MKTDSFVTIKKGVMLQVEGVAKANLYFVKSGLLRSYTIDQEGKEHIFDFVPEGFMVSDYIKKGQKTMLHIQAIERSVVGIVDREKYESELNCSDMSNEDNKYNFHQFLNRLNVMQERIVMLMGFTAVQKYEFFINKYPNLTERVSQKMIASYLGITPESLCRTIKKNIKTIHYDHDRKIG